MILFDLIILSGVVDFRSSKSVFNLILCVFIDLGDFHVVSEPRAHTFEFFELIRGQICGF